LTGNAGTTPGANFVGTTDNEPLEFWANDVRALRLEPGGVSAYTTYLYGDSGLTGAPNVVGGSPVNFVFAGSVGATIGGGGATNYAGLSGPNSVLSDFGTVGGGENNIAGYSNYISSSAPYATVGGGYSNTASGLATTVGGGQGNTAGLGGGSSSYATVGGGLNNTAKGASATVAGGELNTSGGSSATVGGGENNTANNSTSTVAGGGNNTASGQSAFVGGGVGNTASGEWATVGGGENNLASGNNSSVVGGGFGNQATNIAATVPGGSDNVAGGQYSFAAGYKAQATNNGAFVWADSEGTIFGSTTTNQFNVRANGGVVFVTSGAGMTLDGQPVLAGNIVVSQLPSVVITNGESGVTISGTITNAFITGGTITNTFINKATITNATITNSMFAGNGGGLTNLNPSQFAPGSGFAIQENSSGAPNVIGGSPYNFVSSGVVGATIAGGGATNYSGSLLYTNSVTGIFGTVGGGYQNTSSGVATVGGGYDNTASAGSSTVGGGSYNNASGGAASVGGGENNTASGVYSTVAGGELNTAGGGQWATVSGGYTNTAFAYYATVGGGAANQAAGQYATVPGGYANWAGGTYSFAAGNNAQASQVGDFVWSDGTGTLTTSSVANSVTMRASGGFSFLTSTGTAGAALAANATSWTAVSDRNAKKNFQPVNTEAVLEKLAAIPIEQWNYKWEKDTDVPNIGPMAQDFKAAFFPGRDDKGISTLEFDGVELAAIQGLNQKLNEKDAEIQILKQKADKVDSLEKQLQELEATVKALAEKN
jgi:hypothetical protein